MPLRRGWKPRLSLIKQVTQEERSNMIWELVLNSFIFIGYRKTQKGWLLKSNIPLFQQVKATPGWTSQLCCDKEWSRKPHVVHDSKYVSLDPITRQWCSVEAGQLLACDFSSPDGSWRRSSIWDMLLGDRGNKKCLKIWPLSHVLTFLWAKQVTWPSQHWWGGEVSPPIGGPCMLHGKRWVYNPLTRKGTISESSKTIT